MDKHNFHYLIVGAGILGSAIAWLLSRQLKRDKSNAKIGVIDIDLDGEFSSTLKNAGGVRATWRNRANVELCKYSLDFFEKIRDKIDFKQNGYYWLHNKNSWKEINANLPLYRELGLKVELFNRDKISDLLPFVENIDDVEGISISKTAGIIDHYSLREYYRSRAKENDVEFINNQYVFKIENKNSVPNQLITLDITELIKTKGIDIVRKFLKGETGQSGSKTNNFNFDILINSTGAWSSSLSESFGFFEDCIKPRRRQIGLFYCPDIDLSKVGMVIDTSNAYFHQEGKNILAGYSNMDEPYGVNFKFDFFSYEDESPFTKYIWKPLVKRSSLFQNIKFIRGWSGIYGETDDKSGFLGRVPGFNNIYECVGHTGRGLMISYGAAQAMVDLILKGEIREEISSAVDLHRTRPKGNLYEELHL